MKSSLRALAFFLAALMAGPAAAGCHWETQCNAGPCRQIPVCDSIAEFKPIGSKPPPSPTSPPPPGVSCHQQKVCDRLGNCNYKNICM